MQDQEFHTQFENCTLPKEYFRHYGHLRICWIYLSRNPLDTAIEKITVGIKRYATSLGAAHIYHDTLTKAWVYLVHAEIDDSSTTSFEDFISKHPHLLDKTLPYQYFSEKVLNSESAKAAWVEPDLSNIKNNKK